MIVDAYFISYIILESLFMLMMNYGLLMGNDGYIAGLMIGNWCMSVYGS